MKEELETSGVLVELDCILDTRLATLKLMGDDVVENALPTYFKRPIDVYPGVPLDRFLDAYHARDTKTLQYALGTKILKLVEEFCVETRHTAITTPFKKKPKIYINTYPYTLTDSEVDVILKGVVRSTRGAADVEMVHMTLDDLHPRWMKSHLSLIILYEYDLWFEHHAALGTFKKATCPEVAMVGPMLFFKDPGMLPKGNPFADVEQLASPIIALSLLPAEMFSVNPTLLVPS